jgi:SAM-dependent methyltransferase
MFDKSQNLYDAIYAWKDYPREAALLRGWIERAGIEDGASLLDVACGTGGHIPFLRYNYDVEGLDLDEGLLAIAREKNPGVVFHTGDMTDFDLGREFDVVTCLFSAVAYAQTTERLGKAIGAMARHLKPGGVLIFDPFVAPDAWKGYASSTARTSRLSAWFIPSVRTISWQ